MLETCGLLERAWEAAGPGPGAGAGSLRVLQFNCLADGLAQSGGFARCPPEALEWGVRRAGLEAELERAGADLLGLQEVNHFDDWLRGFLSGRGYATHFLKKAKSPCLALGFPADGLVLAWKESRFELEDLCKGAYEGFGQGAAVATLRERATGRTLVFGTTHLKAKPEGAAARMQQAQQLADRVAASAKRACTKDVIITGDFNEKPGEVLRVLEGGEVPLVDTCRGWSANGDAAGPAFTTWKFRPTPGGPLREKRERIDYVLAAGSPRLCARLTLPSIASVGPAGLPSTAYPSDHFALALEFSW